MRAMILAAGFGTRLWPLTEDRTKPAIPFFNKPLIAYAAEYLASYGIRDLIVNLHHEPDSVRAALGDGSRFGVRIDYSFEEEILGTSGALDRVREQLTGSDFVVINGKIVTTIDLSKAIEEHRARNAIATLVLRPNTARERFSVVETGNEGRIIKFGGFPTQDDNSRVTPLMFTGVQVLSPRIFDFIPRGRFSHSTSDVYPKAIEAGESVIAHVSGEDWFELSTLSRYLEVSRLFMRKRGVNMVQGEGSVIEPGASVTGSVLWNNVVVEGGARLSSVVVGDDVRIPAGSVVEHAVIVRRDIVKEVERGRVAGENLIVPIL